MADRAERRASWRSTGRLVKMRTSQLSEKPHCASARGGRECGFQAHALGEGLWTWQNVSRSPLHHSGQPGKAKSLFKVLSSSIQMKQNRVMR